MLLLDETGYPIEIGAFVRITKPMHYREPKRQLGGLCAEVVAIDTVDWRTGEPRGDSIIHLRLDGDQAITSIPPARIRVLKRRDAEIR